MKYLPTPAIVNNAMRGLALLEKNNSLNSQAIRADIEELSKAVHGEMDKEVVSALYVKLLKAQQSYSPKTLLDGYNVTPETARFLALGGNAAVEWCKSILDGEPISKQADLEESITGITLPVSKSTNTELKQATFVVMVPNEVDLHGDITSEDEVRKACHSFNKYSRTANLFHLVETDTFEIAESWISPVDFSLDGKFIVKGTWLCTIQALDDNLWALIKSGDICSVSIGALAKVEILNEEENE